MNNIFGHGRARDVRLAEKKSSRHSDVEAAWGMGQERHLKKAAVISAFLILLAGGSWYAINAHTKNTKMLSGHTDMESGTPQDSGGGTVTAAGVTQAGIDPVPFAINFLEDTGLCVEKVYVSEGDTVAAGQKYLKFTEDSIDKARAELERTVQSAELAYRSKALSNGENSIQAKYTYDTAVLEASFAQQIYQDTLTGLEMQLVRAENAYREAQEAYDAYELAVENNTFYEDFRIEKLKKAYEEAYDLCTSRGKYWDVTEEELRTFSNSSQSAPAEQDDRQWIIRTVALLREEAQEAKAEYEQAKRDYQREIEGAELKLQKLFNQLELAEQEFTEAQIERQKGSMRAKTLYEQTVAKGQMAENDYNVCLMSLADELEHLKDAWDEAVKNKELFEAAIGDGYLYTERAGTVARIQAEEGQTLADTDVVLAYGNPEVIFVSAAVPGEVAAKIFPGDRASVTVAEYGSFGGYVERVDRVSAWGAVMVTLEGDVSALEPNLTAAVVFGDGIPQDTVQERAAMGEAVVSETASPMFDLDIFPDTEDEQAKSLEIAEMYAETGQYIREGDLVCRFTQESVERVQKALTYAQTEAQIALLKAQADYHVGVTEAGLAHNEALTDAALAQTVYDNTIAELNSKMAAKNLEIEQLLADIYQLQQALTDDSYAEQRTEITRAYDRAKKQMEKVKESFVTSQVEAAQTFQAARESYEDFFSQFEISNQQIAEKVDAVYAIQDELLQSQQLLEKELVTAEQTRSSSQLEGEIAYAKYADSVKSYENAVSRAQADLAQVERKLDDFNRFAGEGAIYATGDGLVVSAGCRKGERITDTRELVLFVAEAIRFEP